MTQQSGPVPPDPGRTTRVVHFSRMPAGLGLTGLGAQGTSLAPPAARPVGGGARNYWRFWLKLNAETVFVGGCSRDLLRLPPEEATDFIQVGSDVVSTDAPIVAFDAEVLYAPSSQLEERLQRSARVRGLAGVVEVDRPSVTLTTLRRRVADAFLESVEATGDLPRYNREEREWLWVE